MLSLVSFLPYCLTLISNVSCNLNICSRCSETVLIFRRQMAAKPFTLIYTGMEYKFSDQLRPYHHHMFTMILWNNVIFGQNNSTHLMVRGRKCTVKTRNVLILNCFSNPSENKWYTFLKKLVSTILLDIQSFITRNLVKIN